MLIKGSILQKDTTILDVYALENKVLKHVGQNLLELPGGTDFSAMVVGTGTPFPSKGTEPTGGSGRAQVHGAYHPSAGAN